MSTHKITTVVSGPFAEQHSTQIRSFKELPQLDSQALLILDVDEVLITTEDHFGHPYAEKIFLQQIDEAFAAAKTEQEKKEIEEALSLSILSPKRVLVERETPQLIKNYQQQGVKVIALTCWPTGPFGLISNLEKWRIEHLDSLQISFSSAFPDLQRIVFEALLQKGEYLPLFEQGILFSPNYKKGIILKEFLRHLSWKPSRVIFVDDLKHNIESVETELSALQIPCQGFQYLGAQSYHKPINEKLLQHQFKHLLLKREWLSDKDIKE